MVPVVFVAPFFMDATLRFVRAVSELDHVRLAVISQEPRERLPAAIAHRTAAFCRIHDGLDPQAIADGVREVAPRIGGVHRLLGTLEQLQIPLGMVRDLLHIPGLGEATARNFRDKGRMKDVLRAAGLPVARHRTVTDAEAAWAFVREVGFPVVVKPREGAAAVSTYRAEHVDGMQAALAATQPAPSRPVVIEEFVTGEERSFETVSLDGKPLWHASTIYAPSPLTVLENPWIQWTVVLPREVDAPAVSGFASTAYAALSALGMETGISHMEWFRTRSGAAVISEVAARPPGAQIMSIDSFGHDVDFYRMWARLVVHGRFEPPTRRYAVGAAYFRGAGKGRVVAVHGVDRAQAEIGSLVVEARLPQRGQVKSSSYEGEGYAILRHSETRVVEEALKRLISLVRVEVG
ncbi:MAG: ATP-grasp domain-containing protein [Nannocystaceae bacterium]